MRKAFIALIVILLSSTITPVGDAQRGGQSKWQDCFGDYCQDRVKRRPTIVDQALSFTYAWLYVAGAIVLIVMFRVHRAVQDVVGALQGTAWELIRLMENTTPDGPRNRAQIAEATTEKFAVDGNARILRSALISTDQITPELTHAGLNLMERHANDAAQFRAFRGALRAGIAIYLSLMAHRNTHSAFVAMIEYLKRQRDRKDAPSFAELKMVFNLPVDPPEDTELRHRLRKGLTFWDYYIIGRAVRQRRQIFGGLAYHPPTPAGTVVTGDAILVSMRDYLH